jgi:regulatory protein SWI5
MLSNPTSNLHARQRAHRRQNSTPTAFEAVKIPNLPNVNRQQQQHHHQHLGHRRGLSLDTRQRAATSMTQTPSPVTTTTRQDFTTVSTTTNQGIATQHHVLREAQQQRIQARPGPRQQAYGQQQQQQHQQLHNNNNNCSSSSRGNNSNDNENYLISPHGTPQAQRFDASCYDPTAAVPFEYSQQVQAAMMHKNQAAFAGNMGTSNGKDFELYAPDSAMSTPTFMGFQDNSHSPSTAQGWNSEGGHIKHQTDLEKSQQWDYGQGCQV